MSIDGKIKTIKPISGVATIVSAAFSMLVIGCATSPAGLNPEIGRAQMISQLEDNRPPFSFPLGAEFFAGGEGAGSSSAPE